MESEESFLPETGPCACFQVAASGPPSYGSHRMPSAARGSRGAASRAQQRRERSSCNGTISQEFRYRPRPHLTVATTRANTIMLDSRLPTLVRNARSRCGCRNTYAGGCSQWAVSARLGMEIESELEAALPPDGHPLSNTVEHACAGCGSADLFVDEMQLRLIAEALEPSQNQAPRATYPPTLRTSCLTVCDVRSHAH